MQSVEIRVKGQIDEHWSTWFEGLTIAHTTEDETVLTGGVRDQADLYGLLTRLPRPEVSAGVGESSDARGG